MFFDRLLGVFALPSLRASGLVEAIVIGAPGLVWAFGGWAAGGLSDRLGRARTIVTSMTVSTACAVASAIAPSDAVFAGVRTVAAGAQVTVLAAVSAALVSSPRGLGRAVGVSFMTTRFAGGSVAPAVVAAAAGLGTWRLAFAVDAALVAVLALLVLPLREPARPAPAPAGPTLSRGAFAGGLLAVAALSVALTVPAFVVVKGSALASRLVQFWFGAAASIATLGAGLLADRLGAWRVAVGGLTAGVAGAVAAALGGPLAVALVLLAAASGTVPLGLVALPLADAPPGREGAATALPRFMAEVLGGALGAVALVRVAVQHGTDAGFAGLAAFTALFVLLAWPFRTSNL